MTIPIIPILSLLKQPLFWRFTGFISSIIGLLCYALSSSFKHLFGEWNSLKIFLYGAGSLITCSIVLLAKKWQLSRGLMLKAHVGFMVLMLTSVYSFFYDKAVKGKPDALGLVSCAAFALVSFSLSRQIDLGFEVDLLNFFLGCLMVQLMKINLLLASLGGVLCYFLIVLRSSLDSQQVVGSITVGATASDHLAIEIERVPETRAGHGNNSENNNNHTSLRKRHFVTSATEEVHPRNAVAAYKKSADAARRLLAAFREHDKLKEKKELQFFNPGAEAREIVATMKIPHGFHKAKNMSEAAIRIQRTFRRWKIRKEYLHTRQQAIKIQASFRGFQVRKQHSKILWSIGVIHKAIMSWRFKRRGFRGLYVMQEMEDGRQEMKETKQINREENDVEGEKRANELVIKFMVHVRSNLRSKRAQEEYTRMRIDT